MIRVLTAVALVLASATPAAAQRHDNDYRDGGFPPAEDARGYPGNYPGGPGYGNQRQTITCESWQYRPNRCPVDTRGGVVLQQQTGGTCVQGRTWGYDRGGIWVDGGCRAIFLAGGRPGGGYPGGGYPGGPGPDRVVTCQSWQYQPARCAVDIYRGAQLVENISTTCNGRNWGWDRGGIWVNNGCRGRFRVY